MTIETRVALTDDESRRRFGRYWLVIGPFSSFIRQMALRLVTNELDRAPQAPTTPPRRYADGRHPVHEEEAWPLHPGRRREREGRWATLRPDVTAYGRMPGA